MANVGRVLPSSSQIKTIAGAVSCTKISHTNPLHNYVPIKLESVVNQILMEKQLLLIKSNYWMIQSVID